ncbi:hypothetical protein V5O48_015699 [Marasmius crinis-equi]|uniref:Uncharacterized protein n=1 Tax=Marasmius crinis-equi TaxID=585013 RepID=A0ABR3ETV0_9AGAR
MSPRIFWFILGAGAATWWSKHHQMHYTNSRGFYHHHIEAPPSQPSGVANPQREADRERMRDVTRQAGNTVTDMSEASLDMLLTTVESLKEKLAQHRLERERMQAEQRQSFEAPRVSGAPSPNLANEAPRHLI